MNKNTKRLVAARRKAKLHIRGRCVNSTVERSNSGKKRYDAPTLPKHPMSGIAPRRFS